MFSCLGRAYVWLVRGDEALGESARAADRSLERANRYRKGDKWCVQRLCPHRSSLGALRRERVKWRKRGRRKEELTVVWFGAGFPPNGAILGACFAISRRHGTVYFLIQPDASTWRTHRSKLDQLMDRRDAIYDNLRESAFEYRAGKYSEAELRSDEDCDGVRKPRCGRQKKSIR